MQKLKGLPLSVKLLLALLFFGVSFYSLNLSYKTIGYISLFAAQIVIFESLGLSLFIKILSALCLGMLFSLTGILPAADLVAIKPVGSKIFMNGLTMVLVPLVFASIVTGVTNLKDLKKLHRIGLRTLVYYLVTTAIAIIIGLGLANVIQPGQNIDSASKDKFFSSYQNQAVVQVEQAKANTRTFFETVQDIVPHNIMESVSLKRPDMLALIFFAVFCGVALLKTESKHAQVVIDFFNGITDMSIEIVTLVMHFAPYGVFALMASAIAATESLSLVASLIPFSLCVMIGLFIHTFVTNSISLKFLSKKNPIEFFKQAKEVATTAFSTASSGATMPLTLATVHNKMNVKKEVAGFVIPLGATVNMDGTALFQGVSAVFLANIYGVHLGLTEQVTVIVLAVLASIGTAAVPAVGIVILTMILVSVGIPPEGILFILPVNNILDMLRTTTNVVGDMACAVYIDTVERRT